MARLYLFFIASRGGQKGHMLPPPQPPRPHPGICRIMNDFFLFGVRWVGCVCVLGGGGGGGGGGGDGNLPPSPLYPYPTQSIYICVGVVAERTVMLSRILHGLALVIVKLAGIIFAA